NHSRESFPNLRVVYLSSRTFGGHSTTNLNPEPYAYESAFAVRWVIQDAIKADTGSDPAVAWGPYLWTDGVKGRSDGIVWTHEDVRSDGTHPSDSGREKAAQMLLNFFKSD